MSIAEKLKERNPEMFKEVMALKEKQYQKHKEFLESKLKSEIEKYKTKSKTFIKD